GRRAPATERVVGRRIGHGQGKALLATPDDVADLGNGQAGEGDGYLVAGADVQGPPALQRAEAYAVDRAPIQFHGVQLQQRGNAASTADLEMYLANLCQCLARRVLPGDSPARRLGYPEATVRSLSLAQHHSVAGEGQRCTVPALAPLPGLLR